MGVRHHRQVATFGKRDQYLVLPDLINVNLLFSGLELFRNNLLGVVDKTEPLELVSLQLLQLHLPLGDVELALVVVLA